MDITFSIDFDAREVSVVVDNCWTLKVIEDGDDLILKDFEKLDDDILAEAIAEAANLLLKTVEEE